MGELDHVDDTVNTAGKGEQGCGPWAGTFRAVHQSCVKSCHLFRLFRVVGCMCEFNKLKVIRILDRKSLVFSLLITHSRQGKVNNRITGPMCSLDFQYSNTFLSRANLLMKSFTGARDYRKIELLLVWLACWKEPSACTSLGAVQYPLSATGSMRAFQNGLVLQLPRRDLLLTFI